MAPTGRPTRRHRLALVAAGGALGAVLRFAITGWVADPHPLGTLAANALGTFLLGIVLYKVHLAARRSTETRLLVGTGFCGSFTTFSTFAFETLRLAETGESRAAALNAVISLGAALLAVTAGAAVGATLS